MTSGSTQTRRRNVLPKCVQPLDYHLHIVPNFTNYTFTGEVSINLRTHACTADDQQAHPDVCNGEAIKAIKLNYNDLVIDAASLENVTTQETQELNAKAVSYHELNMTATIPLATPLQPHQDAVLKLQFTGNMNDKLVGFYRSKYKNADGKEIYMGTTQFESVDARRAFPCWDEPAVKAVFHITLTVPAHMRALSNMHVVKHHADTAANTMTYTFAPTPKMSTYLVAWIIGELDVIQTSVKLPYTPDRDTLISLYAAPGQAAKGQYALDLAARVLPLYEKFFEVGYNLEKLDLVAIPDFAAGAMENWGLITYRESALFVDSATTTAEKKYIALVVAHELAHQWFGNLVTMAWWKELWLNEAFATYMEYVAVDKLIPEWSVFTEMLQREGGRALQLDALRSSHPVEVDVCNAQEIDDIFDAISYSKGSCIIRMIVEYIGETAFQQGMSKYIAHFKYGNATTVDLWKFLGDAAGQDIAPLMAGWTGTQGYPYLTVSAAKSGSGIAIEQHRFLSSQGAESVAPSAWSLPLLVLTPDGHETAVLVTPSADGRGAQEVALPGAAWVKVNSRQCGFCRVLYSEEMLNALKPALQAQQLGSLDRLGLLSDYSAFAQGGYVSTVVVLELMTLIAEREDNLSVWTTIAECESSIRHLVATQGEEAITKYNAFCQKIYRPTMERLGFEGVAGEPENDTQLRGILFSRLVAARDSLTLEAARSLCSGRRTRPIPQNQLKAVFAVRVREGGAAALAEVKELADTVAELSDRHKYLGSIAAAVPESLSISDVFDYCLSPKVRPGEVFYVLRDVATTDELTAQYWEEVVRRWTRLREAMPPMMLGHVAKMIGEVANAQVAASVKAFYEGLSEEDKMAIGRSIQQGAEQMESSVQWAARDAASVAKWLQ